MYSVLDVLLVEELVEIESAYQRTQLFLGRHDNLPWVVLRESVPHYSNMRN